MYRTTVLAGSLCLALVGSASAAEAQSARDRAEQAIEEANAHAEEGRHALAAERYLDGYDLMREAGMPNAPLVLWMAGDQLSQLPGRERDAIETLRRFLHESTTLADEAAQVRDWRSSALSRLDELEARVSPEESETAAPTEQGPQRREHLSPIGPIVLGIGIGALGVGGVFGALALVHESSLSEMCGGDVCLDSEENRSLHSEMLAFSGVSDGFLIGGGLVAVTGLVLLFALDPDTEEVAPEAACTTSGCWAGVRGSF